jgi:hypothetical protein
MIRAYFTQSFNLFVHYTESDPWFDAVPACQKPERAASPDQRNRSGQADYHCEYGAPSGAFFGNSVRFWLNLQTIFDLEREKDNLAGRLSKEVQ